MFCSSSLICAFHRSIAKRLIKCKCEYSISRHETFKYINMHYSTMHEQQYQQHSMMVKSVSLKGNQNEKKDTNTLKHTYIHTLRPSTTDAQPKTAHLNSFHSVRNYMNERFQPPPSPLEIHHKYKRVVRETSPLQHFMFFFCSQFLLYSPRILSLFHYCNCSADSVLLLLLLLLSSVFFLILNMILFCCRCLPI